MWKRKREREKPAHTLLRLLSKYINRVRYRACYQNKRQRFIKSFPQKENHRPQHIRGNNNLKYCARNQNVLSSSHMLMNITHNLLFIYSFIFLILKNIISKKNKGKVKKLFRAYIKLVFFTLHFILTKCYDNNFKFFYKNKWRTWHLHGCIIVLPEKYY